MAKGNGEGSFEGGNGSVAVDLSNVEEASFEALPVATYDAVVYDCEFKYSQNSGAPMWSMQLQIVGGEYDNRRVFDNISFSEKALPFTKKTLGVIAPELLSGPFNPEEAAAEMRGKQVKFKTKIETYEGNKQTRIKQYLPLGGADAFMNG